MDPAEKFYKTIVMPFNASSTFLPLNTMNVYERPLRVKEKVKTQRKRSVYLVKVCSGEMKGAESSGSRVIREDNVVDDRGQSYIVEQTQQVVHVEEAMRSASFHDFTTKFAAWKTKERMIAKRQAQASGGFAASLKRWVVDPRAFRDGDKTKICSIPRNPFERRIYCHVSMVQLFFRIWRLNRRYEKSQVIQRCVRCYIARSKLLREKERKERILKAIVSGADSRLRERLHRWKLFAKMCIGERVFEQTLGKVFKEALLTCVIDTWRQYTLTSIKEGKKTVENFKRWTKHRLRCRSLYTWCEFIDIRKRLRNFVKERLWRRWKRFVFYQKESRKFKAEYFGALEFQRLYRGMRARDLCTAMRMKVSGDLIEYKRMRKRKCVQIQCFLRVCIARWRMTSRSCSFAFLHGYLLPRVYNKVVCLERCRQKAKLCNDERLRSSDEKDHVDASLRAFQFDEFVQSKAGAQELRIVENEVAQEMKTGSLYGYMLLLGAKQRRSELKDAAKSGLQAKIRKRI
eukprot:g651.t1